MHYTANPRRLKRPRKKQWRWFRDTFADSGQMIIPGSSYWNIGSGRAKSEVEQDEEALRIMQTPGQNMAWLLRKINV